MNTRETLPHSITDYTFSSRIVNLTNINFTDQKINILNKAPNYNCNGINKKQDLINVNYTMLKLPSTLK